MQFNNNICELIFHYFCFASLCFHLFGWWCWCCCMAHHTQFIRVQPNHVNVTWIEFESLVRMRIFFHLNSNESNNFGNDRVNDRYNKRKRKIFVEPKLNHPKDQTNLLLQFTWQYYDVFALHEFLLLIANDIDTVAVAFLDFFCLNFHCWYWKHFLMKCSSLISYVLMTFLLNFFLWNSLFCVIIATKITKSQTFCFRFLLYFLFWLNLKTQPFCLTISKLIISTRNEKNKLFYFGHVRISPNQNAIRFKCNGKYHHFIYPSTKQF